MPNPYTASGSLRTAQAPTPQGLRLPSLETLVNAGLISEGVRQSIEKNAGKAAQGGVRKAGALGFSNSLNNLVRSSGGRLIGAGGLLALLNAAGELSDDRPGETRGKNLADAAGSAVGGVSGGALGAAIGGAVGSAVPIIGTGIGALAGGAIGGMIGGDAGAGVGGGIFNLLNDPEKRRKAALMQDARDAMALDLEARQLQAALTRQALNEEAARQKDMALNDLANQMAVNRQAIMLADRQALADYLN